MSEKMLARYFPGLSMILNTCPKPLAIYQENTGRKKAIIEAHCHMISHTCTGRRHLRSRNENRIKLNPLHGIDVALIIREWRSLKRE